MKFWSGLLPFNSCHRPCRHLPPCVRIPVTAWGAFTPVHALCRHSSSRLCLSHFVLRDLPCPVCVRISSKVRDVKKMRTFVENDSKGIARSQFVCRLIALRRDLKGLTNHVPLPPSRNRFGGWLIRFPLYYFSIKCSRVFLIRIGSAQRLSAALHLPKSTIDPNRNTNPI